MVILAILAGGAMVQCRHTASCHSDPFASTDALRSLRNGEPTVGSPLTTVAGQAMVLISPNASCRSDPLGGTVAVHIV